MQPLMLRTFPRAILHIDGDAFFAACEQARDPRLQGRPVITGKERGIVASLSYEAKARGIIRGMRLFEVQKVCPEAIILPSDYETYSLLSTRFFSIVRRYTPDVEEYSIDECFADLTGLRRYFRQSYPALAAQIKQELDRSFGFTFSVGLGPTKVVAKIASKWKKPSGLTVIPGTQLPVFLAEVPIGAVWRIGPQTEALLRKHGKRTALDFARAPEAWVKTQLTKPHVELWQELNGRAVLPLTTEAKTSYRSIQKMKTFTPPSNDHAFVFAQLAKNIENACMKARRYHLEARGATFVLRTQTFEQARVEVKLARPTAFAHELVRVARAHFLELFDPTEQYRATGVTLWKLTDIQTAQMDLFAPWLAIEKSRQVYESMDMLRQRYGKHAVFLGASLAAHRFAQHLGERGDLPARQTERLPGETARKRLGIPLLSLRDV